jgi:hypothetical protein
MKPLLLVLLLALMPACMSVPAETVKPLNASVATTEATENEAIKGYRQWTRVNPEPVIMEPRVAMMCAMPLPVKRRVLEKENPHKFNYITVYVNDTGSKAMYAKKPEFPMGSVIVKEKLASKDSESPELLTVMIKHEPGYNAANGDWEYMVTDGAGKEVQARGKLENCQACHTMVKNSDYVYRSYLPGKN